MIHQRLNANVVGHGHCHHREDPARQEAGFQPVRELVLSQLAGLEEFLHERVVTFRNHLDQRVAGLIGLALHVLGNILLFVRAFPVSARDESLHLEEIDDAAKVLFFAQR